MAPETKRNFRRDGTVYLRRCLSTYFVPRCFIVTVLIAGFKPKKFYDPIDLYIKIITFYLYFEIESAT